jgi:hypothetical protein
MEVCSNQFRWFAESLGRGSEIERADLQPFKSLEIRLSRGRPTSIRSAIGWIFLERPLIAYNGADSTSIRGAKPVDISAKIAATNTSARALAPPDL